MFGLFIQLALSSVLFFVQKQGKFAVYCLSDVHQVPQTFRTEPLQLLKAELELDVFCTLKSLMVDNSFVNLIVALEYC